MLGKNKYGVNDPTIELWDIVPRCRSRVGVSANRCGVGDWST
jgi:hypothetical protein